ncbi:MAG: DUF4169 family protein [Phreatobacter sp.]|nr:DUF4169 family protein [Phreatobacter sp.]
MGDVVNLKRERKRKVRQDEDRRADANRLRFGRPAADRKLEEALEALELKRLDGHKRSE